VLFFVFFTGQVIDSLLNFQENMRLEVKLYPFLIVSPLQCFIADFKAVVKGGSNVPNESLLRRLMKIDRVPPAMVKEHRGAMSEYFESLIGRSNWVLGEERLNKLGREDSVR
jgi:hypothetical protein